MKPIHFSEMKKGKLYYIESNANNTDRQIARFKDYKHVYNDMYIINFEDIGEIKKKTVLTDIVVFIMAMGIVTIIGLHFIHAINKHTRKK